jgi:hypothetical protein
MELELILSLMFNRIDEISSTYDSVDVVRAIKCYENLKPIQTLQEKTFSDLSIDHELTIKAIIQSAYSNPQQKSVKKFKNNNSVRTLDLGYWTSSLEKMNSTLKRIEHAIIKFDSLKIRAHEVGRLKSFIDKEEWLSALKFSRWHGPFKSGASSSELYSFHTVNEFGDFTGLMLDLHLSEGFKIFLNYLD